MADSPYDTIVAPITGAQRAAVAIVRVSGPEAWAVAAAAFSPWPAEPQPRVSLYGRYGNGDEGLAVPFEAGHSYTGEEAVELSIHGSPASVRSLTALCVAAGARPALPGEFTQRAFLNGRMDLTQAEAVRDTVEAQTDAQLRAANLVREGVLYRELSRLRSDLAEVLVAVEASTDFSEEIGELDRDWASERIEAALEQIERLLATATSGRIMRDGLRIAIVGPPNSGKSSLLNALLGSDRAIVTEIPGTTRDFVEESADLGGVPCVLIDTAGLRETTDSVESLGVQRSRAQAANADLVWYVFDLSLGWMDGDESAVATFNRPVTVLGNKCDLVGGDRGAITASGLRPAARGPEGGSANRAQLTANGPEGQTVSGLRPAARSPERGSAGSQPPGANGPEGQTVSGLRPAARGPEGGSANRAQLTANGPQGLCPISALTGAGLPELIQTVRSQADVAADRPLINTRHEPLLAAARAALRKAGEVLHADLPADLLSTCLQEACSALGQITGETASAEMLEAVFSRFCIGK